MLYNLNLCSDVCHLFLDKTGEKVNKKASAVTGLIVHLGETKQMIR